MSALKATTSLIFVQVFSRLSTFAINQASLRYLSPALLGASTQLELLSTTILTFARDSLRVALARQGYDPNLQGVVNAAHLPVVLAIPLTLAFTSFYTWSGLPDVSGMAAAVNWIGLASVIELLAEPAFALVQVKGQYGIRANAETTATIVRCIATFAAVVYGDRFEEDVGVLPFAYGQMAYATTLLIAYLVQIGSTVRTTGVSWLPKQVKPQKSSQDKHPDSYFLGLVSRSLLWLAFTLSAQTIVKQLLGEGDHVVMALFASLEDQGSYDLAHNYGSLIARMLLQPVEEGCRGLFGRLCANTAEGAKGEETAPKTDTGRKGGLKEDSLDTKKKVDQARSNLELVLRLYWLFTCLICAVGPSLAPLLLRLIAGAKWSSSSSTDQPTNSAGTVLATYCYLLPFMAFNGILEAFVSAVASPKQLYQQSFVMSIFTAAFGAASVVFLGVLKWGAHGLVLAQCVAMGLRILWSWRFSQKWFTERDLGLDYRRSLPSTASVTFIIMAAASIRQNVDLPFLAKGLQVLPPALLDKVDTTLLQQLVIKGVISGLTVATLLMTEQDFWWEQYQMIAPTATGGIVEEKKKTKKNQ